MNLDEAKIEAEFLSHRPMYHHKAADYFGSLWETEAPPCEIGPVFIYGPHQIVTVTQDLDDIKAKWAELWAQSIREICLFELKHVDVTRFGVFSHLSQAEKEYEDSVLALGEEFYFRNITAVREYLRRHRLLIDILFELRRKINEFFGSDTKLRLEVFTDPEDDTSKLFALILTALPSREVSPKLNQLDQEWWLGQSYEVKRAMNVDIEYLDGKV